MKITLDSKSLLLGFVAAGLMFMAISFKSAKSDNGGNDGKFRAIIGNSSAIVILDSETGNFIIAPEMREIGKVQWIKGDFGTIYQTARDNKKTN
jgi:hypothetical protein